MILRVTPIFALGRSESIKEGCWRHLVAAGAFLSLSIVSIVRPALVAMAIFAMSMSMPSIDGDDRQRSAAKMALICVMSDF